MNVTIRRGSSIRGEMAVPADKAIGHRAALCCALVEGVSEISPWPSGDDCQRTLGALQGLGVASDRLPHGIRVHGVGLSGLQPPRSDLDCGESGTTIRLAAGLLAGQPFESRLTASASLCQRPMRRIAEPLTQMGARIVGASNAELHPPLHITGRRPLRALRYSMPIASAQVKSAILLAGLSADGPTTISEPYPTRDHTERLFQRLGIDLHCEQATLTLKPPRKALHPPGRLLIPGDVSSAAFFIVAATMTPDSVLIIRDVGLNPTRSAFLTVLRRMGASLEVSVEEEAWEPRGTIRVVSAPLHGTTITAHEVPQLIDELPILMVAACAAQGATTFEGLEELRVKETDRLHSMTTGLRQLGAQITPDGQAGVKVAGGSLRGNSVESFNDHRTAMSLAVAGLIAEGETTIQGAECARKSFGEFFEVLASVRRG
ncbi:MAG: 3-phosphoshikimate 1-carboxyvinyltransferase [Candidatus Omnitrophica bacterium]|nr:3-phosphoshikimate 1-carboxyvinyltransferase [Candidatus Omnitrophota bacterium]